MPRLPIDDLESYWHQDLRSVQLRARFAAWQAKQPVLSRFSDPAAVVSFMRRQAPRADKDAVLFALLVWAKHEEIGARMVLEIIRPGLLNLSSRIMRDPREREELWSELLLAIWQGIRSYPLARRPRRIAANLLLDALHGTLVERGEESAWRARWSNAGPESQHSVSHEEVDQDVDALLERAIGAGALTTQEAELVLCSRIDGVQLVQLARQAGVSYNTIKVRRQRAERRLLLFLGYRAQARGQQRRPSSLPRAFGAVPDLRAG